MSAELPAPAEAEYRPYRRFLSAVTLALVAAGTLWVLISVVVTIRQRGQFGPAGPMVSAGITPAETDQCMDELWDTALSLEKHVEDFHDLLAHYAPESAQDWAEEGLAWNNGWKDLGRRCRFGEPQARATRKRLEQMAAAHDELGRAYDVYTAELTRYGKVYGPRLDKIRERLESLRTSK